MPGQRCAGAFRAVGLTRVRASRAPLGIVELPPGLFLLLFLVIFPVVTVVVVAVVVVVAASSLVTSTLEVSPSATSAPVVVWSPEAAVIAPALAIVLVGAAVLLVPVIRGGSGPRPRS